MKRLFIFGIGGTGSRVIRSLQMLLAANVGKFDSETEIIPIIIDYDVKNGDKLRTVDVLEKYSRINREIYDRNRTTFDNKHPEDGFFSTKVREMKDVVDGGKSTFNMQYTPPSDSKKYSDSIGHDSMSGELDKTKSLLNMLYNTSVDQEFAELHIDTTVGFRGNPNIGSVMLHDIENTNEFKEFVRACEATRDDRVVIIGSLFGGTGSSGIPVLVNAIRNNSRTSVNQVKISTILVCPYFKIAAPRDNEERSKGVIDDKIFESKTKAALYYYEHSLNDKIDAIYYVGDTNKGDVDHNIGKEKQMNPAHLVELVSALAICHFHALAANQITPATKEWKYGFKRNPLMAANGDANAKVGSVVDFNTFATENLQDIRRLVAYTLANRIIKEYILTNASESSDKNYYKLSGLDKSDSDKTEAQKHFKSVLDHFVEFFGFYRDWIEELGKGSGHHLELFDFDSKELCDVTKHHEFRVNKKNFFLGKVVKNPTLKAADILTAFSEFYKSDHQQEGKDKDLRPGESPEYAFYRSLYCACEKIVNEKFVL